MVAGLLQKVTVFRHEQSADNVIGGAVAEIVPLYEDIPAAVVINMPNMNNTQNQGIIVPTTYSLTIQSRSYREFIILHEDDEIKVTWPRESPLYGQTFVVIGIQYAKRARKSKHIKATLRHIKYNRREQG